MTEPTEDVDVKQLTTDLSDLATAWREGARANRILKLAASTISKLERERDDALARADDYRERLHDLVLIDSEEWAIGGGPGFKERRDKAWTAAREPFEP